MDSKMKFEQIRNATIVLEYADKKEAVFTSSFPPTRTFTENIHSDVETLLI